MLEKIRDKISSILMMNLDSNSSNYDNILASDPEYLLYSPTAVGYSTTQEQNSLFMNVLSGYSPATSTILDIGAGRGDLYQFIKDFWDIDSIDYIGVERNPVLVDAAKQRYNLDLICNDFQTIDLPSADWVIGAGIFFERRTSSESADTHLLIDNIDQMYNAATLGVSFNLLSPINNEIHDNHFYVHPGFILDILIERYKFVTVKHNYSTSIYSVTILKF